MNTRTTATSRKITYTLQGVISRLPHDVDDALFLKLANRCLPGAKVLTDAQLRKLVVVTRNLQRLPFTQQLLLLSRAAKLQMENRQPATILPANSKPEEQTVWIKERVSESFSWVRDLKRLGVASASSYIFAGRRTLPRPPKDWANEVLYFHFCQPLTVQDSLAKYLETSENAFLKLPDRRWHIKYRGEASPPLPDKFGGLGCIHALIKNNYLGHIVVREKGKIPFQIFMPTSTSLSDPRQARNLARTLEAKELDSGCTIQSFASFRGNQAADSEGQKIVASRSNPEDRQISRAIREIAGHNNNLAHALDSAITRDQLGVLSFRSPDGVDWLTDIPQLTYDASLERNTHGWVVRTPLSEEPIEVPGNRETGMTYIARVIQQPGVSIPVGLLANSQLLEAITDRPPYQKLFQRTHTRLVRLGPDVEFDPGTSSLIEAVNNARGYRSKYYEITHVITKDSLLAKYIDTGFVSLTPDGLAGVLYLLKKRLAGSTIDGTRTQELLGLVDHMDKAVKYVKRYESLTSQIEPESNRTRDKVQKAIRSAIDNFWGLGEAALGRYLEKHIQTGKLVSHNGPWLWEVRGLSSPFPDVMELAQDHIYMKLRKFARENSGFTDRDGGRRDSATRKR